MSLTMPVFQIFSDSFDVARRDSHLLAKSLMLPSLCLLLLLIISMFFEEGSPQELTLSVLSGLSNIVCINMTTRLILNRTPEKIQWKSSETKTLLFALGLIFFLGAFLGLLTCLIMGFAPPPPHSPVTESFFSVLHVFSVIIILYVFGRTVLIFPAIAVGKKINLSIILKVSANIVFKLLVISFLPALFTVLMASTCMLLLPVDDNLLIALFSVLFVPAGILSTIAMALAYKRAEPYLLAEEEASKQALLPDSGVR